MRNRVLKVMQFILFSFLTIQAPLVKVDLFVSRNLSNTTRESTITREIDAKIDRSSAL